MNTYSKVLKYISIKDVKQKHQEKIIEKIHEEVRKKEERQYIQSVMEDKKYDWRKEVNEGMTSSGMFFTTLPATGDVNLAYPSWNSLGGYNYSISGGTVTITNSGVEGPESGIAASFDTSLYDTLVIDVGFSGDTILGVFYSGSADPLLITTNSGTYNITVPQSKNQALVFLSATLSNGTVTISNLRFQRITPLNVFVPLDSPEATSFIRTDPIMANLSPQERLQKLQKMLDASDEYVEKILGKNFPGTGTRPAETIMPNSWETAQYSDSTERNIDAMLLKGLQRGDYGTGPDVDKQIRNLQQNMRNNTPGGRGLQVQTGQDTQIAQQQRGATGTGVPDTTGTSPGSNPPPRSQMNYPREWLPKQAQSPTGQNTQVAHYEPQGELISEKKKLKSPEEILNKIPGYYDGKPAPLGFPIEPPPEMKNGMHPDLVDGKKIADRFNRLDPQSAEAMPLTGNPEIDKRVKKARKQPK